MILLPTTTSVKSPTACFADPPWDRNSPQWIDIDHRLEHNHLARFIDEAVGLLDLRPLFRSYHRCGSQPYNPALMLKIVMYKLAHGHCRPAPWAKECRLHDELKWLGFGICPSRSRFYHFVDRLGAWLDTWLRQVMDLAVARGITIATRAALDGSTIAANASRHRMLNRKTLDKRLAQLEEVVAADKEGRSVEPRPWWMAKTVRGRRGQLVRYQEARAALGRSIASNARRKAERRQNPEKIVVAPADPGATPGRDKLHVFRPLYNAQVAYDLDSEMILAAEVFAQQNDTGTLPVLLSSFNTWVGHPPTVLLTDATYATVIDATACAAVGTVLYAPYQAQDVEGQDKGKAKKPAMLGKEEFTWDKEHGCYVCPSGHTMPLKSIRKERRSGDESVVRRLYGCPGEHCQACPLRAKCTPNPLSGRTVSRVDGEEVIEELRVRMKSPDAKKLYKRRRSTVERAYADLKVHRRVERFGRRGLARVRLQFRLHCLAHNLWILGRHLHAQKKAEVRNQGIN